MPELLNASKALLNSVDHLPDQEWISISAYLAPELEQMAKAIEWAERPVPGWVRYSESKRSGEDSARMSV